jgi:dihydrofolate reductase
MKVIVACDLDGAIGKDNQLPWKLSWDLKNFKSLTMGGTVLMGRKTYNSIGHPLLGRRNIVLSNNKDLVIPNVEVVNDFYDALALDDNLFVIGGESLYRLALPFAKELHMTVVHTHIRDADAFFPNSYMYDWITVEHKSQYKDEKNEFDCSYYRMVRQ